MLAFSPEVEGSKFAFALGQLGFLANAQLGNGMRSLAEFVIETVETTIVDLERLWLMWEGENLFVIFGRMHTDIGYWNAAYHHGAWLQTTVDRPRLVSFEDEGGVLPVHSTGLLLGNRMPIGSGALNLRLSIGNGRGHNPDDIRVVDDTNNFKAIAGSLFWDQDNGKQRFGVSALYDRIAPAPMALRPALPDVEISELIGSAHYVRFGEAIRVLAEGFWVAHSASGQTWQTLGGFLLGSVRTGRFEPYLRLEAIFPSGPGPDPFFVPDPTAPPEGALTQDFMEVVGGLRLDVADWSALKLELRYAQPLEGGGDEQVLGIVNWAFGI